jgi:hypothetical protein
MLMWSKPSGVKVLLAVLSFGLTQPVLAFHYECKADLAVGYIFDDTTRSWTIRQLQVPNEKYTIRPLTEEEKPFNTAVKDAAWGAFEGTDTVTILQCPEPKDDVFSCGGLAINFVLDARSRRYQKYYLGGYVHGRDDNNDTPSVEMGRCNQFVDK